jgi:glycosyltransferase involved in cell wall biosynthesis
MKILFIHQNFPGQFKHLAPALAAMPGYSVKALVPKAPKERVWQGVELHRYTIKKSSTKGVHPWVSDTESKTIRGEACFYGALELQQQGYEPDLIIAHPGWGESLFLKEVWPNAKLGIYCEYYYRDKGGDIGFDPEFSTPDPGRGCRLRLKNTNNILHFDIADAAISPTRWQAGTFPEPFRHKISVIHDGIDTRLLQPRNNIALRLGANEVIRSGDEVITFVNRNLEPTRGYHQFMRALPGLLAARPQARVIIVGGDGLSYGAKSKSGKSWKQIFIEEVRSTIADADWQRVFFVGNLPYAKFCGLLQLSTVHVYLTYPFVLSWSLLEAMSIGCTIVASDTAPLHEVIRDGETGVLVDFFDPAGLCNAVTRLLEDPDTRAAMGARARQFAVANYDLNTVCLPAQLQWVENLARGTGA